VLTLAPDWPGHIRRGDRQSRGGRRGIKICPDIVCERFPKQPFLLPDIGRQGGDVEATVRAAFTGDPASCLVAVARAIIYADNPRAAALSWRDRIRAAAEHAEPKGADSPLPPNIQMEPTHPGAVI
jgi:hypothetical protein